MQKRKTVRYGWRPDLPDHRDHRFAAPRRKVALPEKVSLRARMPRVLDQGNLGSCTAHAGFAAFAYVHDGFSLSRLKLYYDERALHGETAEDNGAYLRDAVNVLNKKGAAPENLWPYFPARYAEKPPATANAAAARNKITAYQRVAPRDYAACLAAGFPFVIGFSVYEGFEGDATARTGRVLMPKARESLVGGHAVCIIGYAPKWGERHYEVRNSWGASWGDSGNCWIPARYLEDLNLADDAWTIRA